jgi:hypothetical protein
MTFERCPWFDGKLLVHTWSTIPSRNRGYERETATNENLV